MAFIKNKITLKDFKLAVKGGLKVLHWDLETSPSLFYGFSCGEQYVDPKQIKEGSESKVISVQYKWEGEKNTKYLVWDWNGIKGGDDKEMLREFTSNILAKADITIGQNIDSFDYKVFNDRLCMLRLPSFNSELSIDILKLSRKSFRRLSHKLDFRSKIYGLGGKHRMELQDWVDIVEGKVKPEKKMIPYGCKDVDDAQHTMYREWDYYARIPVPVEKKIVEFLPIPLKKYYCPKCKNKKHASHNLNALLFCKECGTKGVL